LQKSRGNYTKEPHVALRQFLNKTSLLKKGITTSSRESGIQSR